MSVLTKILIVLLTLSSIFLCGIVVTYVANADNYKQLFEKESGAKQVEVEKRRNADTQLETKKKQYQRQEDEFRKQIALLNTQVGKLENDLKIAQREKADLLQRVNSMAGVVETSSQTAKQQTQLFEKTQEELKKISAEQIREREQLKDVTNQLIQKMAVIKTLQADKKRLEQEKYALQLEADKLLQRFGKKTARIPTVTPEKTVAREVTSVVKPIGLTGSITALDLKRSLAAISIGTAHGVRENMKFYVTRGDEFICEILIYDVDAEKAVGDLKRVRYQPKVGDSVSTNL